MTSRSNCAEAAASAPPASFRFAIKTAVSFSLGSTQKCVLNAPLQPKLPSESG